MIYQSINQQYQPSMATESNIRPNSVIQGGGLLEYIIPTNPSRFSKTKGILYYERMYIMPLEILGDNGPRIWNTTIVI